MIQRLVRSTALALKVKQLYDYRCQLCDTRLETPAGPNAEAAHVRPLDRPHNGPDSFDNILCLCPNHYVLFDAGGIWIGEHLEAQPQDGRWARCEWPRNTERPGATSATARRCTPSSTDEER
ncbi:HNH endonuclease [Micromonospora sp. IBSANI012]|uniref:HNH endonuclease n=1 Tax=Micromonospora sp. IBSANI012 TaxID=3457761 RepID=UPI00405A3D29